VKQLKIEISVSAISCFTWKYYMSYMLYVRQWWIGGWLWMIIWAERWRKQSLFKVPHTLCSDKKKRAPKPSLRVTELITSRRRNRCANYSTTTLGTDAYIFRIPWNKHPEDWSQYIHPKVRRFLHDYMASHPRRHYSYSLGASNLTLYIVYHFFQLCARSSFC